MEAFEAIKSLRPAQRFYALVFIVLITTGSAVLTSYMQTDDCKGLSDQYSVLIGNHTELMKINNDLLASNNQKERDIMKIMTIIDSMQAVNRTVVTKCKTSRDNSIRKVSTIRAYNDTIPLAMERREPEVIVEKVETTTVIQEVPSKQKSLIGQLENITDKYKKKSDK
jgi:hypothetical protein